MTESQHDGRGFRPGQGRPVGLLVSWLLRRNECATAAEHVKMKVSPRSDRVAAREMFCQMDGGAGFAAAYEREQRDGEVDEPHTIP